MNTPLRDSAPIIAKQGIAIYPATGTGSALHSHDWIELAYLERGTLVHTVGGITYTVNEGDYFIVEYGQPHSYFALSDGEIRLVNVMFSPWFIDPMLNDSRSLADVYNHYLIRFSERQISRVPTLTKFEDSDYSVRFYIRDIVREVTEKKIGWEASARSLLIYVIIHTLREVCSSEPSVDSAPFSQQIINFVNNNYMRSIKICDAFPAEHYSVSYLSKRFKQEMGVTFSEYLKHVRIDASCRLLVHTDRSVMDIAVAVGYRDTTFFHNTFREIMRLSPSEYRRRKHARSDSSVMEYESEFYSFLRTPN